mgnify:CR=1 FL=1
MSYIDVERTIGDKTKTIRLEYDRASIVEMEKMGYNAARELLIRLGLDDKLD